MSLIFSDQERQLKDGAARFLDASSPVSALRRLRDKGSAEGFDRALWQQMVDLGWAGVVLPEQFGGLDFGYKGLGAMLEESGRNLTASPLFASIALGASLLMLLGNSEQKQRYLPPLAAGELTLALALDEGRHHRPTSIATSADRSSHGYTLNGRKTFVLDGHIADQLIVVARMHGGKDDREGIGLFLVAAETPGVRRDRSIMVDSRNAATIHLDKVRLGESSLLGEAGQGWAGLETALDRARVCLAAEMLGSATACFERTTGYLREREQFGVRIGSFQALQHRAAILYTELQLARSVVMDGLNAIDQGRPDLARAASLAKATVNETFRRVADEAVQMHGGIGVTDEMDIGFFLKRSRVAMQILGDTGFHRNRYARLSACHNAAPK